MRLTWPSDTEAYAALKESAHQAGDRWTWMSRDIANPFTHSEDEAIQIAKACLYLGVAVTDTVTATAWLMLIERVARLEGALLPGVALG